MGIFVFSPFYKNIDLQIFYLSLKFFNVTQTALDVKIVNVMRIISTRFKFKRGLSKIIYYITAYRLLKQ